MSIEVTADLRAALIAAFPAVAITREAIDDPLAHWDVYEETGDLGMLEGKTWLQLEPALIEHHAVLPVYAGDALFRAVLPAYLLHVLEHDADSEVPYHVAGSLTRKDDSTRWKVFDRRVAPLTVAQRAAVHRVLKLRAAREPARRIMTAALETWDQLLAGELSGNDNDRR